MVAAGIPQAQADHADRVARSRCACSTAVNTIAPRHGAQSAGPHRHPLGPIVAGVIGTHKFVYDVWGDTVNTASRMESHLLPGRVQVSAATRALLGDRFDFEPRGIIEIKGKGMMETFFSTDDLSTVPICTAML